MASAIPTPTRTSTPTRSFPATHRTKERFLHWFKNILQANLPNSENWNETTKNIIHVRKLNWIWFEKFSIQKTEFTEKYIHWLQFSEITVYLDIGNWFCHGKLWAWAFSWTLLFIFIFFWNTMLYWLSYKPVLAPYATQATNEACTSYPHLTQDSFSK